jgi:pyruvate,water dikinase
VIVGLDSPAARDAAAAGSKARTLARLRASGFPVPDGFVVTAPEDARSSELAVRVAALEAGSGAGARFAVRSSGQAEDSAAASFAGQYETVLGVQGLAEIADAIERCFASFASGRADAYQRRVSVIEAGGAVIVQHLVEAEAAGVAFTLDPVSGACDRVLVDAAAGLGDAVVGGRVTPDGFVVAKAGGEILERRLAQARACLDDDAVRAVAALAQRVEAHEGAPVDIEWAWQRGAASLLQARPITGAGRVPGATGRAGPPP